MRQPKSKNKSLILIALLIAVMTIFAGAGMTYAYFQGSKLNEGKVDVGKIGLEWRNGFTTLSKSTTYQLAGTDGELERGNTDGTNLTAADGSAGGDLRLQASSTDGQYVRVTFVAKVGETDVSSYITFRYVTSTSTSVFGSDTFWKKGDNNWYYYVNTSSNNVLNSGGYSILCNNIVLSGEFPTSLLGETITITFSYEAIQSTGISVASVWGDTAASILK